VAFLFVQCNRTPHDSSAFAWMAWNKTPHIDTPRCKTWPDLI